MNRCGQVRSSTRSVRESVRYERATEKRRRGEEEKKRRGEEGAAELMLGRLDEGLMTNESVEQSRTKKTFRNFLKEKLLTVR